MEIETRFKCTHLEENTGREREDIMKEGMVRDEALLRTLKQKAIFDKEQK